MLTAQQVADYFLYLVDEDAGDSMTNLRLQKFLYYAQAWHLAITDDPLLSEHFEAWDHGPVIPSVYRDYSKHGWGSIPRPRRKLPPIDENTRYILDEVWRVYGQFAAKHLEELTHAEDPWIDARRGCEPGEACSTVISQSAMRDYYAQRLVAI